VTRQPWALRRSRSMLGLALLFAVLATLPLAQGCSPPQPVETAPQKVQRLLAAGDVASAPDVVRSHRSVHANWLNAVWQARVAATAMVLGRARGQLGGGARRHGEGTSG